MSRWKALVVDDEPLARTNLQLALAQSPRWLCVAACAHAAEARQLLSQQPVDLLLLDVRMPRQSGLSLAAELRTLNTPPPLVVFVTAYADHALQAFEVQALDYLLKPFDDERFAAVLARAEQVLAQRHAAHADAPEHLPDHAAATAAAKHLHVRSTGGLEKVPIANIQWVRSAGNYVELHTPAGMVLHRSSLEALAQDLPAGQFIRVHRTALARASAITALSSNGDKTFVATLACGVDLPVSGRFLDQVRKLFA